MDGDHILAHVGHMELEEHEQELHHGFVYLAATALSGLGATLSGLNSLYGLAEQTSVATAEAAPAMVGSAASGAVALLGGWLAASKLSAISSSVSFGTAGLAAGAAYASVGLLYFVYSIVRISTRMPPRHSPTKGSNEAKLFPSPDWLSTRVLNWGVMGRVGVGKSTLINALRGLRPRDTDAAPVGIGHTTRRPKPYNFVGDVAMLTRNMARLWDLPGAGTKEWPCASYVRDAGLRHFDGVIFVTSDAFSEVEAALMRQLQQFKVPYYIVRNKVDQDVVNNAEDHNCSLEESLAEIRHELFDRGCEPARTFLISAKNPRCADFEFGMLLRTMANDVVMQRGELPEFVDDVTASPSKLKDATAFAAASFAQGSIPYKGQVVQSPAQQSEFRMSSPAPARRSTSLRRSGYGVSCSPLPGQRSTSASSCETPPPTRLYTNRVVTPEPVSLHASSAAEGGNACVREPEPHPECPHELGLQPPVFAGSTLERMHL